MTYFVVSAKGELIIFQISSKNALYHWLLFNKLPHMSYIKKFIVFSRFLAEIVARILDRNNWTS